MDKWWYYYGGGMFVQAMIESRFGKNTSIANLPQYMRPYQIHFYFKFTDAILSIT